VDIVNTALKGYGVSHLGVGTPTKLRTMFGPKTKPAETEAPATEAVHAELRGDVGVIRISSFLVPVIRHEAISRAFLKVRGARAVLIDLRGNPGGSGSSVVYTAQYLLGPDVLVDTVRTRRGFEGKAPHVMRGFFPDELNAGSDADIQLNKREGHVEWRTPTDAPAVPRRPTYLLVDGACGSSCEIFAAAIADSGVGRVLGQRTAGKVLTAQGVRGVWNGYLVVVPFGTVLSPRGRDLEGKGVEPDVVLRECEVGGDAERCMTAALEQAAPTP
jgi:C-terminal processing protease CtpA/Prc